ncbi:hypothetical protein GM415_08010 [Pseudodesulfovibrio cashew]|uniref:Uncharacterized protein n=1 Tax=Pseudodesulfovibrio cashew TaxID=2678688 RepID=A0A6I6JID2_9BACT|nr:hypothetical protein [Pseudodesulfovibrio cashew]QGY40072.1 hypothetical protein GM415_08010 [Pseudodesulfovibrio cashew]
MDDPRRDAIRQLAEQNGLDPAELEAALLSGDIPEPLLRAMEAVLGDIELFAEAVTKADR